MNSASPLLLVTLNNQSREAAIQPELFQALLELAYGSRRKKPACLDLLIVDDPEMTRLNRRHLGEDNTTDVLAFEDGEDEDGRVRLGDIAICAETARRESEERRADYSHELLFYALHGLFHLLGMRDDSDADREKMHQAQAKTMRDYGLMIDNLL